jgi:hypothetical protein
MAVMAALMLVRWRSFINSFTRAQGPERTRARMTPIWAAIVIAMMTWAASLLFGPLFDETVTHAQVRYLAERLPAFALMGAFGMLVLSAMTVALGALYAGRDITLLLAAPVRPAGVFIAKFVDIVASNATLFVIMGFPIVAAYANARGILNVEYAIRTTVALIAFCVLPTALGSIGAILMMRALPANRLREILGAIGLAGLATGYIMLSLAARRLHEPGVAVGTARAMMDILASPAASLGPWAWAGDVVAAPSGYPQTYEPLFTLVISAVASVVAGGAVASALHWRGWVAAQDAAGQRALPSRGSLAWETALQWLPAPSRAYLLKDFRCLGRDLRQLSLLLMPIAVVVVFLLTLSSDPKTHSAPTALLSLALQPIIGMIALRIATSAFVGETNSLLVALASPAGARSVLMGKFWYTALLSCLLAVAANVGYGLVYRMQPEEWVASITITLVGTVALSGIGVGIGARFLQLNPDGTRSTLTGAVRFLMLGLQLVYSAALALFIVPAWLLIHVLQMPALPIGAVAAVAILAVSFAAVVLPLRIGAAHLTRMEG